VSAVVAPVTPGVSGRPEGGDAAAGAGEQRVDVAVVAAGELHHLAAPVKPARSRIADIVASVPELTSAPARRARPGRR
jgi:hypothetical protein